MNRRLIPSTEYPRQFWILIGGTLVNAIGSGMVFPFLTLYLNQRLNLSMTLIGVVLLFWAVSSFLGQLTGGSLTDQFGRKRLMAVSLCSSAIVLALFPQAGSVEMAVAVTVLMGFLGNMYQPAQEAMVADLIEPAKRVQAYGLVRITRNLGIAIGPSIGGLLVERSYSLTFVLSAATTLIFFFAVVFLMHETSPAQAANRGTDRVQGSMRTVLRDSSFVVFCLAIATTTIGYSPMMTLLPVYMKDQYGLEAMYYGWVMTTNAGMVVLFQYPLSQMTARFPRLPVIALGAILYGIGVGSIAFSSHFFHFVASMAVMTVGEMLLTPNATALTADIAPAELRGRYMGTLGLTWNLGFGVGPLLGGLIVDRIAPRALWPIMGILDIAVAIVFYLLGRQGALHRSRLKPTSPVLGD